MRQSIDNLHDDITRIVLESQENGIYGKVLEVIDPSSGIWGGEPIEGLVTIVYQCPRTSRSSRFVCGTRDHSHHALFGPKLVQWADECKHCHKIRMWCKGEGHTFEPTGEEIHDPEHYSLYAD